MISDEVQRDAHVALIEYVTSQAGPLAWSLPAPTTKLPGLRLHVIAPNPDDEEPAFCLFTTGMSDRAMNLPKDVPVEIKLAAYAELIMRLPADWPLAAVPLADGKRNWPLAWLSALASLPHDAGTWLGTYHTVPNGDPPAPLADDTSLCTVILVPPVPLDDDEVRVPDGRMVTFFSVLALHPSELAVALADGGAALIATFIKAGISDVVQVDRAPVELLLQAN